MAERRNNRDSWVEYFSNKLAYWSGNGPKPDPRGLYGNFEDDQWSSKYSSMADSMAIDQNRYNAPGIRDVFRGTKTSNPMREISDIRQYGVLLPESKNRKGDEKKIKASGAYKRIPQKIQDQDIIITSLKEVVKSNDYKKRFKTVNSDETYLDSNLEEHYRKTKHNPDYPIMGGQKALEEIYREATDEMERAHDLDAQDLVTETANHFWANIAEEYKKTDGSFDNDRFKTNYQVDPSLVTLDDLVQERKDEILYDEVYGNIVNPLLVPYRTDPRDPESVNYAAFARDHNLKLNSVGGIDYKELSRLGAKEILKPIHQDEEKILKGSIDKSRFHFRDQHKKNRDWARICAQQDPELLEAAQQEHKQRCIVNKDAQRKQEENERENNNALISARRSGNIPAQLTDDILLANNEDDLPTLDDFIKALESPEMKSKNIQFKLLRRGYTLAGVEIMTGVPVAVTFNDKGQICLKFPPMKPDEVLSSKEVRNACDDIAETIWCSYDQKNPPVAPVDRVANLVASSDEHAHVLIRAIVARGFNPDKIKMTILERDKKYGDTKYIVTKDGAEAIRLGLRVRHYNIYQSPNVVTNTLNQQVPVLENQFLNASDSDELERMINQQEKPYQDILKIFDRIIAEGSRKDLSSLGSDDIAKAHAAFAKAVDGLNTLQLTSKKKDALGYVTSAASLAVNSVCNTIEGLGSILRGKFLGTTADIFNPNTNRPIAVKKQYTADERAKIVEGAQAARTQFVTQRDEEIKNARKQVEPRASPG